MFEDRMTREIININNRRGEVMINKGIIRLIIIHFLTFSDHTSSAQDQISTSIGNQRNLPILT